MDGSPVPPQLFEVKHQVRGTGQGAHRFGAVASAPAVAMIAGTWHGGDPDHLWQPETEGSQGVSVQPEGSPGTPICPVDAVLCVNSASLAPFLSYFMHPDAHQGQDLRDSHPFELEENGELKIYCPPRKISKDMDPRA